MGGELEMIKVFFFVIVMLISIMFISAAYQLQAQKYHRLRLRRAKENMFNHVATAKDYELLLEEK